MYLVNTCILVNQQFNKKMTNRKEHDETIIIISCAISRAVGSGQYWTAHSARRNCLPLMTRLRHFQALGAHLIHEEHQLTLPIYDAIAQALHTWNPRGLPTGDACAYEDEVVWLLQHLPRTSSRHDVAHMLQERFPEHLGSSPLPSKPSAALPSLATAIWDIWSQYRQRHETSPHAPAQARGPGLMRRHYYPGR